MFTQQPRPPLVLRSSSRLDRLVFGLDRALRAVTAQARAHRPLPVPAHERSSAGDALLSAAERRHAAGLMRVNHAGEICAQALYDAQARQAHTPAVRAWLEQAGREEEDHLAWTAARLRELQAHPSRLNPLWYLGSYLLGSMAGRCGDAWSLGWVMETERQVEAHLAHHLDQLPRADLRSRAIVARMRADEAGHAEHAQAMGARALPAPVPGLMRLMARIMTRSAYIL